MRNMQGAKRCGLRHARRWTSAGLVLAMLHATGCMQRATEPETNGSVSWSSDVPELGEIQATANLSDDQVAAITPAYATWVQAEAAWMRATQPASEPPVVDFLVATLGVLEGAQFSRLAAALHGVQATRATGFDVLDPLFGQPRDRMMHGGRGRGPGHGGPGRGGPRPDPFADLGLSAEQLEQVRAARTELKNAVAALVEQYRADTITEVELEAGIEAARAAFETALQGILTAEQYAQLQAARRQHLIAHLTARLERFDADVARRVARLDAALELSETQVAEITAILTGTRTEIETVLAGLQNGSLSAQQALAALRALEETTTAAIRATLTEAQAAVFDTLARMRRLFPGCRP
jgi:hypothetical protein